MIYNAMSNFHLKGIDFTRSICSIGIIAFHFACHSNCESKILYITKNGSWGSIIVATFFIISGCTLYYNYEHKFQYKSFYYKRWKSIFPSFYVVYFFCLITQILLKNYYFTNRPLWTIIYTILGIDGYLLYLGNNYYLVGEWFLGAIIFLYILYPLLSRLIDRSGWVISFFILLLIWYLSLKINILNIHPYRDIFSCQLCFFTGMYLGKNSKYIYNFGLFLFAIIGFVFLLFYPILAGKWIDVIVTHMQGLFLFLILSYVGSLLEKSELCERFFHHTSELTFNVFLLQHQIILIVLGIRNPYSYKKMLVLLFISITFVYLFAEIINMIIKKINKSILFKRLDNLFLSN